RPCLDGGTRFITVVSSRGIMIPVSQACTMRPASSGRRPGESTQTTVPIVNSVLALENTWRVEQRPDRTPVSGLTTAMHSMQQVVSHCAVSSLRCRSAMIGGSATDRVVSFRISTKALTSSSVITLRSRGEITSASAPAEEALEEGLGEGLEESGTAEV